jgi:hypothetical protein
MTRWMNISVGNHRSPTHQKWDVKHQSINQSINQNRYVNHFQLISNYLFYYINWWAENYHIYKNWNNCVKNLKGYDQMDE